MYKRSLRVKTIIIKHGVWRKSVSKWAGQHWSWVSYRATAIKSCSLHKKGVGEFRKVLI